MTGELENLHKNETAWIVGKGPSLPRLRPEHIGSGPVFAINQAIIVAENLKLPNLLYSFQKDGCINRDIPNHECGGPMIYPAPQTKLILIRPGYSEYCLSKHPNRIYVDPVGDFGFSPTEMSARICVAVARRMGCSKIILVCCDSFIGDDRTYDPVSRKAEITASAGNYSALIPRLMEDFSNIPFEIFIPQ